MMNIGLTGGMGCGKSTALQLFRSLGCETFEADAHVRTLLAEDAETQEAVRKQFGGAVFGADGRIDRGQLASIVFPDPSKLEQLEAILHPRVRAAWQTMLNQGFTCLVVEIPLLFEKSLSSLFDATVCVYASEPVQLCRLSGRGLDPAQIRSRLARQWSAERKMEAADHVLLNDGSPAHLEAQIRCLLKLWEVDLEVA